MSVKKNHEIYSVTLIRIVTRYDFVHRTVQHNTKHYRMKVMLDSFHLISFASTQLKVTYHHEQHNKQYHLKLLLKSN